MKVLSRLLVLCMMTAMATNFIGCNNDDNIKKLSDFSGISYSKPIVTDDIVAYGNEVRNKDNKKNNNPVENGIVICPYYILKVNGKEVSVYTTRCENGTHSFAWIDVKGAPEKFNLKVELTTDKKYSAAIVLPEKRGVNAVLSNKTVTAEISEYGDYSFAFATDRLKTFKVTNQPLTLIVAPESVPTVPEGYEYIEIEPGKYGYDDLVLKKSNALYRFKKGEYELRRIIASKLENIVIYFDPGTYVSVYETPDIGMDQYNIGGPVLGIQSCNNISVKGRALFDFSAVRGMYKDLSGKQIDMTQYVFNIYNSNNVYITAIMYI